MRSVRLFVLLGSIALAACTAAPVAEISAHEDDDGTSAVEGGPVKEPGEAGSPNEPAPPTPPGMTTCATLGMNESSWFLRGLDASHIAMGYQGTANSPTGHYGYPDYPAGQLRTSALQLARFLLMFAQDGTCGNRVLGAATVKEIERVQVPGSESSQGLVWYYDTKGGTKVLGHNGGDKGVSSDMFFDPVTGNGYVLLSNGATNVEGSVVAKGGMEAMNGKLMELARTLP